LGIMDDLIRKVGPHVQNTPLAVLESALFPQLRRLEERMPTKVRPVLLEIVQEICRAADFKPEDVFPGGTGGSSAS